MGSAITRTLTVRGLSEKLIAEILDYYPANSAHGAHNLAQYRLWPEVSVSQGGQGLHSPPHALGEVNNLNEFDEFEYLLQSFDLVDTSCG